jgi:ribonuclease P/MRP protein subunit RPP40
VVMSLGDILQGDFFTEYIKKGAPNYSYCWCLLITISGDRWYYHALRGTNDCRHSIHFVRRYIPWDSYLVKYWPLSGVLTMFVDKETHQRAGLPGKPYGPKGGRGSKPRWSKYQGRIS